jgi:CheY-like chemotaxis protein
MSNTRPVWAARILVVDDNRAATEMMALLLKLWGYQPLVAFDGPTALEIALTHEPDVIVLDVGLPRMDGHEVARRIRAAGMEKTPLVALTGYGGGRDEQASLAAGFDRHLVKPVHPEKLQHLLGDLVASLEPRS